MKLKILIRVKLEFPNFIRSQILICFLVVPIVAYIKPLIALSRHMHHTTEAKRENSSFEKN